MQIPHVIASYYYLELKLPNLLGLEFIWSDKLVAIIVWNINIFQNILKYLQVQLVPLRLIYRVKM